MKHVETKRGSSIQSASPPPLLVFADDWGRHPSSCQHLIRRLRSDTKVLWVNTIGTRQVKADKFTVRRGIEKLRNWRKGLQQVSNQMWVLDVPMIPGLSGRILRNVNRLLVTTYIRYTLAELSFSPPVVLTTLPYIHWLIRGLPRRALIYYCTDDYSHWPSADRVTLLQADRELSQDADLILAASRTLEKQHDCAGKCRYFPHGVDVEHFATVQDELNLPPSVAALPGPRIGFFGLIYEKLDFALLTAVANRFANASIVLIGPVAHCPAEFAQLPNVHLLGPQPYESLPRFIAGLDVLLLPYVNDEMIRQSGPLKLRECMASGKPTVGIDIPDIRSFEPHVRVGGCSDSYLDQIAEALLEMPGAPAGDARRRAVAADGWDRKADDLRSILTHLGDPTERRPATGRRRVMHLRVVSGRGGGPEKTLLNSPRFLTDRYQVRLLYIHPENDPTYDMSARAAARHVDLAAIPERGAVDPRTLWKLLRAVVGFRPHLLHTHDYKTNLLGLIVGRCLGIPVVTTLHGYVTRGGRLELYYFLDRIALPMLDHVVSVSADLERHARRARVPCRRRSLIENAIDTDEFRRRLDIASSKAQWNLAIGRIVIGAMGRLAPEKGFDILIRAARKLIRDGHDLEVVIAGEGDEEPKLRSMISEIGLTDRIRLLGHVADTRSLYEALDIFVLSSYREGLPNVVLEALAMSVPVVATRVAGIPIMIQNDRNGILVKPGCVEELAAGIARMLGDTAARRRLAEEGRRTVVERYNFKARMQKIQAVYDGILHERPWIHRSRLSACSRPIAFAEVS